MSSSKSQSVSSILGEIDLRRVSSPANSSKRESILDEIGREESWSTVELNMRIKIVIMSIEDRVIDGDRVNIQSKIFENDGRNIRRSYVQEEIIKCNNVHNDAGNIKELFKLHLQELL
uniref:Uncharacterized protein n=1 Tax=Tanacetum cinerariifolium TaxID=118510 RepID=A0A6L2KFZ4_TANCI|nr:hypothetical protein [Tanacetum cinerariifolium]